MSGRAADTSSQQQRTGSLVGNVHTVLYVTVTLYCSAVFAALRMALVQVGDRKKKKKKVGSCKLGRWTTASFLQGRLVIARARAVYRLPRQAAQNMHRVLRTHSKRFI